MGQLNRLKIWQDPAIREALAWYLDVAENRRPAKLRIAATVATNFDPAAASEDALWAELDRLTPSFLARWEAIRAGNRPNRRMGQACWSSAASLPTACSPIAISAPGIAASTGAPASSSGLASSPPAQG